MMENMTEDTNTLREKLTEILRDEHYTVAGLARSMNLAPETLAAWHSGKFDGDAARVERIVWNFVAAREAFWNGIKQGDARAIEDLKGTLVLGIAEMFSRLVREAGCTRQAELIEAQGQVLLRDLELASKAAPGCTEVNCWACGSNIWPPPADIDNEIEKNLRRSAWAAWSPEAFRERCRGKMQTGDRITYIAAGQIFVRRPDKTTYTISQFDA